MERFAVQTQELQALEATVRAWEDLYAELEPASADAAPDGLVDLLGRSVHVARGAYLLTDADLDPPGPTIRYVNPAWERLTGYRSADVVGRSPRLLQGPGSDEVVLTRLKDELTAGRPFDGRIINYRADGSPFVMQWRTTPVRDPGGRVVGYVSMQDDVTTDWLRELHVHERLTALRKDIGPPDVPELDGLEVALVQEVADSTTYLGGDWADVFEAPDGIVHLIVGDVTGHGAVAGIHIGRYRWALLSLLCAGVAPAEAIDTIAAVNHRAPAYATLGIVTIDVARRRAEVITAGHPDVVVVRGGVAERFRIDAPLLGAVSVDSPGCTPIELDLQPGDIVCLCSDGLVERRHDSIDRGIEALAERLVGAPCAPDQDLDAYARRVVDDLTAGEVTDDVLVVMARLRR